MQTFLKQTFIYTLTLLLLIGSVEYMLRKVPNPFTFKKELIESHGDKMKTIILGNSIVNYGVNPSLLGDSTYNIALSGQWFQFNKMMLETYLPQMPNLKYIIWGIATYSLWMEDKDDVDIIHHQLYMDFDIPLEKRQIPLEIISLRSYALRKWSKYYISHKETVLCDSLGFDHSYSIDRRGHWWREDIPGIVSHQCSWKKHDKDGKIYAQNIQYMHQIAQLCQQRGIKLILVTPPVHPEYFRLMDKKQFNQLKQSIQQLTQQWDNTLSLEYINNNRFTDEDFYDGNHLNSDIGAKKFTLTLKKDLENSIIGYH